MKVEDELLLEEMKDHVRREIFEVVGLIRNNCFFLAAGILADVSKLCSKIADLEFEARARRD